MSDVVIDLDTIEPLHKINECDHIFVEEKDNDYPDRVNFTCRVCGWGFTKTVN